MGVREVVEEAVGEVRKRADFVFDADEVGRVG